jgi:hypothetical protein
MANPLAKCRGTSSAGAAVRVCAAVSAAAFGKVTSTGSMILGKSKGPCLSGAAMTFSRCLPPCIIDALIVAFPAVGFCSPAVVTFPPATTLTEGPPVPAFDIHADPDPDPEAEAEAEADGCAEEIVGATPGMGAGLIPHVDACARAGADAKVGTDPEVRACM